MNLLSDCEEKLNIKTRVELSRNPLIASPIMIGFFRARIVLPACELDDKELSYIFVHELIHYKQRDMFYKWLIQIVVCAHWLEAYREHIMYTFNGYCKTVIRFAAINAWRDRSRRRQKEISLEYLTEEKFYPLGTTDEYFEAPYEEYPITVCGQTVILTNGELAAALLSLPEKNREIIFFYFFGHYTQQEIGEMYGRCRSTTGYQIRRTLQLLHKEMEVLSHGESEPFTL